MYKQEIKKALSFLEGQSQDGMFPCYISDDVEMKDVRQSPADVASSIIVLDILKRLHPHCSLLREVRQYVEKRDRDGLFSYFDFLDENTDRKVRYPADADDAAVGMMVVAKGRPDMRYGATVHHIISNTDDDGIIQVWLEPKPGHHQSLDAVVCTNALRLACIYGLKRDVGPTIEYVIGHLISGRYLGGTRYYPAPQVFLYFLSKLEAETRILAEQRSLLLEAVRCSLGTSSGPASLAMMITAARLLGLPQCLWAGKQAELAAMQQPDGSLNRERLWRYGSRKGYFGSPSLSTALAIEALGER